MLPVLLLGALVLAADCAVENETYSNSTGTMSFSIVGPFQTFIELCSPDGGLNATDFYSFMINVTEEYYTQMCAEHGEFWKCVTNFTEELNNHSGEIRKLAIEFQIFSAMGLLCDNPRVKPECIAEYNQAAEEIGTCRSTRLAAINAQTTDGELRTCLQDNAEYKCVTDGLRKCDTGTFNVIAEYLELPTPSDCFDSIFIG
ncbi:hypothetical protein BsWGS_28366 [Bradybaena similaris]